MHFGLRETLVRSGLAVIAISPFTPDGFWDVTLADPVPDPYRLNETSCYGDMSDAGASPDAAVLRGIVRVLVAREGLQSLPLYAHGWSSGARMALMLPAVMDVRVRAGQGQGVAWEGRLVRPACTASSPSRALTCRALSPWSTARTPST